MLEPLQDSTLNLANWEKVVLDHYARIWASARWKKLLAAPYYLAIRSLLAKIDAKAGRYCHGSRYISQTHFGFSVGKYTYGHSQFWHAGVYLRSIGAFTSLAPNITITGMNHPTRFITTHPFIYYKSRGFVEQDREGLVPSCKNRGVTIGNDVWIGQNVVILPSIRIDDGVIIGAGSVVTRDCPPYAIVSGNPAKVVTFRFRPDQIETLLRIKWWEWEDNRIRCNIKYFTDVDEFLNRFGDPG
ncbi:MAG: CatB-related O-acetyltransferase [Desulfomonile tiedjei]|nr:CatB-related O-acetyltransferase [Desulfomonile tiedjei]